MKLLVLLSVSLALSGCLSTNITEYMKALGNDKADGCVAISTPYGGGVGGRANTPGSKLNMSGGQCSIEIAPLKP